ncbi:MAG: protein kinase [Chloroflexi bacterium]|nr:protein kinase [Chloroflexota bacterium]
MNDPLIGQHLGNYRIDSVVGRGGMATVYYGWDASLHRPVAVKVIDARYRDNPAYAKRFLQEARAVATWRHDNILQVFYAGQADDLYYFAMEYVDGPDLSQVMKQYADEGELMPHEDVLKIGRAVASALDYAHNQEIIHRDVKPSNVMVAKDGRIALADFGLALNVQQGSLGGVFGTPHYIAPEQARNSAMAVPQSDLYALGVILYEMLTGSVPFDDPSPTTLAVQHLTQPPPPPRQLNPNLNSATEKVLLKALHKQSEDRYQTGEALMEALSAALNTSEMAAESEMLPPLPGVVSPDLSQITVAERVSLYMPPPPPAVKESGTPVPQPPPSSRQPLPATAPVAESKSFPVSRLFAAGIVVLILMFGGWMLFGRGDSLATAVVPTEPSATTQANNEPQTTAVSDEGTVLPLETEAARQEIATDTAVPPSPPPETNTPAPEPTTVPPTDTAVPQPTDTAVPQLINPPATEASTVVPTATPSGPRLVMLYDATGFYLYNPNANNAIRVSQLVFESLDENGDLSGYWLEGRRWSQFYSYVEPFSCVRLEITKLSSWLRPSQCREYNATITPEQDGDIVFWMPRTGVAAFRVLWQGQEVGRCDVVANQCETYLP